jgi:hypothetical protein
VFVCAFGKGQHHSRKPLRSTTNDWTDDDAAGCNVGCESNHVISQSVVSTTYMYTRMLAHVAKNTTVTTRHPGTLKASVAPHQKHRLGEGEDLKTWFAKLEITGLHF